MRLTAITDGSSTSRGAHVPHDDRAGLGTASKRSSRECASCTPIRRCRAPSETCSRRARWAKYARIAEQVGFGGFALTEHPSPGARWLASGGHQSLDPFVALSYVAAVTTTMKLLTYVSVMPYRNPLLLAKTAATVDKLSDGRFILGVGTGYLKGEFRALGVDMEERNALFDEALDVLPMHWSGEPFSYKGRHFEAVECIGRPCPVQQPIPIWIGGNAKITRPSCRRTGTGLDAVGRSTGDREDGTLARARTDSTRSRQPAPRCSATASQRGVDLDVVCSYMDRSIRGRAGEGCSPPPRRLRRARSSRRHMGDDVRRDARPRRDEGVSRRIWEDVPSMSCARLEFFGRSC